MAFKLKKKHVWNCPRVVAGDDYIEAFECKGLETLSLIVSFAITAGAGAWAWIASGIRKQPNFELLLVIFIASAVFTVAILVLYRPPRVLRFFPEEQLLNRHYTFLGIRFWNQWQDLSVSELKLLATGLVIDKRKADPVLVITTILLFLLGPLGILVGLGLQTSSIPVTTFALYASGGGTKPLAVFPGPVEGKKLIRLYQQKVERLA